MRLSLWLSVIAAFQAYAHIIARHGDGGNTTSGSLESREASLPLGPNLSEISQHERRETRPKCSPPVYNGQTKRDFIRTFESAPMLSRRTMTLPNGNNMDDFMDTELTNSLRRPVIWAKKVNGKPQDMATAAFDELKNEAISFGTSGLCGCTVLVIVSKRAVYIAHYWESISFAPDASWGFKDEDDAFAKTVIKGLMSGVGRGNGQEQVSLKGQVGKIKDPSIRAYLMIPAKTHAEVPDGYRNRWNEIKTTVGGLIPELAWSPTIPNPRWAEIKYDALSNNAPELVTTARGCILFKYDPDHNQKRKSALWIEQNPVPVYSEEWTAEESLQRLRPGRPP